MTNYQYRAVPNNQEYQDSSPLEMSTPPDKKGLEGNPITYTTFEVSNIIKLTT